MSRLNKVVKLLVVVPVLSCNPAKKTASYSGELLITKTSVAAPKAATVLKLSYDSIQLKYARYLKVNPEQLQDSSLYHFIERWLHTPYKWGGMDEKGIDCSAFLQRLYAE